LYLFDQGAAIAAEEVKYPHKYEVYRSEDTIE
jgi:hypothetical protein